MLKAIILCLVLKANQVPVDEPLITNTSAKSNTSSTVNSMVDSSVIGSVEVSNSSIRQVSDEIVNANGSSAGNKTLENEQFLGNGTVMNNITDNLNLLVNISDVTEEEETILAAINETEWSRNTSSNEVNMTSNLSSDNDSVTRTEIFTGTSSPTGVMTPINNTIPTTEPTSFETSNLSNSSIVYAAPTMLPTQSSQEGLFSLSLVQTSSPFNNTQESTAGIIPYVNLTVVPTLTPSYAPSKSFDTTREPATQSFTPSPTVPSNMTFENITIGPASVNQSLAGVVGKVESDGNKTSKFSNSTVLHITPPTIEASEIPTLSPTSRPTDLPGLFLTADQALPFDLKPAPSTASMTFEKDDGVNSENSVVDNGESVGSSLADDDSGHASKTQRHGSGRLIIILSVFVILSITIIVSCMVITRWCWQRWSGYSQIDIGGESIELGVVRDRFLNETADLYGESTYLKN